MSDKSQVVSNIIDNIRRVFQVVNEQSKRAERETGITGPQLWAIKTISQESPIMVSELAHRMYLHPASGHRLLRSSLGRGISLAGSPRPIRGLVSLHGARTRGRGALFTSEVSRVEVLEPSGWELQVFRITSPG